MSIEAATLTAEFLLPERSPDLVIAAGAASGRYVVKHRGDSAYFSLGEQEHFLLSRLDGRRTAGQLRHEFELTFGDSLSVQDLDEFLQLARRRRLTTARTGEGDLAGREDGDPADAPAKQNFLAKAIQGRLPRGARQHLLYFRLSVFNPNSLFNWIEPKIRGVWTRTFLCLSAGIIVLAGWLAIAHWQSIQHNFARHYGLQTLVIAWIILFVVTICHEFAHGLTCKHYGGEVPEVGLLFMFFMPYFYCNVSDAWLMPQKSKRLWITAAGGYCDLCLWALAVIVWRLTIPESAINYFAWCVLVICGGRILFNCNPLLKLDGYYFLSDWLEISNLRRRAQDCWMSYVRYWLWGAKRPDPQAKARWMVAYGIAGWLFSLAIIKLVILFFLRTLGGYLGWLGYLFALYLGFKFFTRVFRGFSQGEISAMFKFRRKRAVVWCGILGAVLLGLLLIPIDDRAGGAFQVRPTQRVEIRAPVAGFLRKVQLGEGEAVNAKALIAQLEVPDLDSHIAQKVAELDESRANLKRLSAGPRPEEVAAQRQRVERLRRWCDLGKNDLKRAQSSLQEELAKLDMQIEDAGSEVNFANQSFVQAETLFSRGAMAELQYSSEKKRRTIAESKLHQSEASKRSREVAGTLEFEAELAKREKELADAESGLKLLEAGGRPEEVAAEEARQTRLNEELLFFKTQRDQQLVYCPIGGVVMTPYLEEKVGQFFEKGALICLVEGTNDLNADITLTEQDVVGVQPGQVVDLKARALPFDTFQAVVDRVAPAAVCEVGASHSSVVVHCRILSNNVGLESGMTGYGRIHRESVSLMRYSLSGFLRYIRTEFWW